MHHAHDMLRTHPHPSPLNAEALGACVHACYDCAQSCTSCADACLGESQLEMLRRCIRLNLDCAAICGATGAVVSRQTEPDVVVLRAQLEACRTACRACGDECQRHAEMHEHCRVCADACRECERACADLLVAMDG